MISRTFYYDRLTPQQRNVYDAMNQAILTKTQAHNLPLSSGEEFEVIFDAVCFDHPEYSYCSGVYAGYQNGQTMIPYMNINEDAFIERVNFIISEIMKSLNGKEDDYSKVKAIFDYLVTHTIYNMDLFDDYADIMNSGNQERIYDFMTNRAFEFTPYATLMRGVSVCFGIAKSFKLLCDLFNVPCAVVRCSERKDNDQKGIPHVNNIVTIDGKDYYVDVTHALPFKRTPIINYNLFLASKEDVNRFYIYDIDIEADRAPQNIFVKNELIFNELGKLRVFLNSYDARKNNREIRFIYTGDEIPEERVSKFCVELLNNHAPMGRQWALFQQHVFVYGLLVDSYQIDKMNS